MAVGLVIFALVLLVWALAAWGLFASMDNQVEALVSTYEIPVDDRVRERLAGSILWTRRWRVAGGVAAAVVAVAARLDFTLLVIAAGVAVGSILAELFRPSGTSSHVRVASLERRTLTDYVNGWVLNALAGLVVGVAISVGLYLTVVEEPSTSTLGVAGGTLVVAGATVVIATWITRRPVPTDTAEALVSHTIRCTSILSVLGSGITALGIGMYHLASPAALADSKHTALIRYADNALLLIAGAAVLAGLSLSFRSLPRRRYATTSVSNSPARSRSL